MHRIIALTVAIIAATTVSAQDLPTHRSAS